MCRKRLRGWEAGLGGRESSFPTEAVETGARLGAGKLGSRVWRGDVMHRWRLRANGLSGIMLQGVQFEVFMDKPGCYGRQVKKCYRLQQGRVCRRDSQI